MINNWNTFGPCGWAAIGDWNPTPDNENLVLSVRLTPAEVLQWVKREKARMRQELKADFRLRSDPKHRLDWEVLEAVERCTRQRFYEEP